MTMAAAISSLGFWTLTITLFCGLLEAVSAQQYFDCYTTGPCSCSGDTGSINLAPLDSGQLTPRFTAVAENDVSLTFYYSPCSPFNLQGPACQNVAVCIDDSTGYHAVGTQEGATFLNDEILGLNIQYSSGVERASVQLLCDPDVKDAIFNVTGETPKGSGDYIMSLRSQYACPTRAQNDDGGLSTGSILCILLVVAIVVYIVTGAIVNKYVVGATGAEIFPHVYFWKEFPLLVKDGAIFARNGFKVKDESISVDKTNYDTI